jgi:hypothetical protein
MNIKGIKLKEKLHFTRSYSTWPPPDSTRFVRSVRTLHRENFKVISYILLEQNSSQSTVIHSYCALLFIVVKYWRRLQFGIGRQVFVRNVVCDISSLQSDRWSAKWILLWVVRLYKLAVAWRRQLILNYFILYNRSPEEWMCAKLMKVWSMTY